MRAQPRSRIKVLVEMPDFRSHQGKRHPLAAILAWYAVRCCVEGMPSLRFSRLPG